MEPVAFAAARCGFLRLCFIWLELPDCSRADSVRNFEEGILDRQRMVVRTIERQPLGIVPRRTKPDRVRRHGARASRSTQQPLRELIRPGRRSPCAVPSIPWTLGSAWRRVAWNQPGASDGDPERFAGENTWEPSTRARRYSGHGPKDHPPCGVRRGDAHGSMRDGRGSNLSAFWRARVSRGREETFENLTQPHVDALWRTAFRMTGDRDAADDLTQEACLRAYRSFSRFKPGSNYRAWIFRILTNLCLDHLRRKDARLSSDRMWIRTSSRAASPCRGNMTPMSRSCEDRFAAPCSGR